MSSYHKFNYFLFCVRVGISNKYCSFICIFTHNICDTKTIYSDHIGKKKDAEHAAAARALDCLSFREGEGIRSMCYGLCKEEPYLDGDDESKFVVPSSMPSTFFDWLENGMDIEVVKEEQPQKQNEENEEEILHFG